MLSSQIELSSSAAQSDWGMKNNIMLTQPARINFSIAAPFAKELQLPDQVCRSYLF
jgi:hypothetical protein